MGFTAGSILNNAPSLSLLRKLGFVLTGTEKPSFRKDTEGHDLFFEDGHLPPQASGGRAMLAPMHLFYQINKPELAWHHLFEPPPKSPSMLNQPSERIDCPHGGQITGGIIMSIRIAAESDLPAMLEIYRPYVENTTYSFEYDVPCLRTFTQRFYDHIAQFPWLVWEEDGQVLGYAYAGAPWERAAYRWCAEVSIYLHPGIHGRGVGRQLYEKLEAILTAQGYRLAYALITTENQGSVEFHKKLGYTCRAVFPNCGYKLGRWLGVIWLEKQLADFDHPSNFPQRWTQVMDKSGRNL